MNVLKLIDFRGTQTKYLTFSNQDGKRWTIPMKNIKVGLEIYQPSGNRGKILKKLLPILGKFGVSKTVLKGEYTSIYQNDKLKDLLEKCFGVELEYSVFWGTPCIDQKITIQIHRGKNILGYCKIGCSERLKELFQNEKEVLKLLEKRKMPHVARCLALEQVDEHSWAFVQSTEKQVNGKVEHFFGEKQRCFLDKLWQLTKHCNLFEETDYFRSLVMLEQNLTMLPSEYQAVVEKALQLVKGYYKGQIVEWGISHRDFTPWNTCVANGELFVFDFEYALRQAPKGLDCCHFFVQTKCFEEKCAMTQIFKSYKAIFHRKEDELVLISYLVDIISLYLSRGAEQDIETAMQRSEILKSIIN